MRYKVVLASNRAEKHVAVIHNMGDDLVPPLKLQRDPSLVIQDEEQLPANPTKINRKKAEVIEYQTQQDEEECREEKTPWLLEDSEQRAFVGKYMQTKIKEDHKSTYYAMVKDRGEARLYKVHKWYKFSPKIQYETLTLEEAEEKIQKRSKDFSVFEHTKKYQEEYKEEDLEYKEVFDDDDGEALPERVERTRRKRLDSAGKDLKKLMKNYESQDTDESNESSQEGGPPPAEKPESVQDISEVEIKMCLYKGPLPIRTLIDKFKDKFKTHPQSKETLRALIKRMCNIRTNPQTGEKLLILKENVFEDK
ncbi:hypothetical protein NECID01_0121 [Nematocida sp. AWRm77]|nr:hypothetical protein NECID01_0121 [Nematocida sp. AWRm77]